MIQRVQNLYLFLALVCLIVAVFLPLGTYTFDVPDLINGDLVMTPKLETLENANYIKDNPDLNIKEIQVFEKGKFFPFVSVNAALALLILLTIIKFKSLDAQYKLNRISFFISLLALVVLVAGVFVLPSILNEGIESSFLDPKNVIEVTGTFSTGIAYYLYFAAVAFIFLASIGIKKDIKLLKSIDRIR